MVHATALRHIREGKPSGCASHIGAEAVSVLVTEEMASVSAMCIGPLIDFWTRYAPRMCMDEKRVSISGASRRRIGNAALPSDLHDETFRSQIHVDGGRLYEHQSLTGTAQLPGVEPGGEAIIYAIEDLRESYSKEHIEARGLKDGFEAMRARWEASQGRLLSIGRTSGTRRLSSMMCPEESVLLRSIK
jgi:hypothetical protein